MTPDEINVYREAFRRLQQRPPTNKTSFRYQASIHANECPHGNWWFLPWHRAYVYYFEQLLQAAVADMSLAAPPTIPYWNWTEQRNMEAVLDLMARGSLDVTSLTTHRYWLEDALDAYDLVQKGSESYVGIVLEYETSREQPDVVRTNAARAHAPIGRLGVGAAIGVMVTTAIAMSVRPGDPPPCDPCPTCPPCPLCAQPAAPPQPPPAPIVDPGLAEATIDAGPDLGDVTTCHLDEVACLLADQPPPCCSVYGSFHRQVPPIAGLDPSAKEETLVEQASITQVLRAEQHIAGPGPIALERRDQGIGRQTGRIDLPVALQIAKLDHGRAAANRDLLQPAVSPETDPCPVGRKERSVGVCLRHQRDRVQLLDGA